jgi:hypothetical protein
MLEENKKNILVTRVYQNTHEIAEDWLRKIKYTILKISTMYFKLMKALLAKKIQFKKEK